MIQTSLPKTSLLLACIACILAASTTSVRANSYASELKNTAGTVSFRLNDSADNVKVIGNAGALTIDLGALAAGLTQTNLTANGLTAGAFKVVVVKSGTGAPAKIGGSIPFNSPRGITVNLNPASPTFGRVYVANSAAGSKGDGLFIFGSDMSDTFGQGATARTAGLNFATGTTSSPYRPKVGQKDDRLYVTDWSDGTGNLYVLDPDVTTASYALKQLTGTAATPVGTANNHGSVAAVEILGTVAGGDLKILTIDEDYQTDPTATALTELNSLWRYEVGAGPLPWGDAPNAKVFTPRINFVSGTMDLSYSEATGYFYVSQLRSAGNEPALYVVDADGNLLYDSRTDSLGLGNAVDFLTNVQGVSASADGKYVATISNNNVVNILPMVNGIPTLASRLQFTGFGTTGNGRGIAFDRANNLYVVSSGLALAQALTVGFSATNTTSSDGTFKQETPSAFVSARLMDPDTTVIDTLSEADTSVVATFKVFRPSDNVTAPLVVNLALTGTATRGASATAGDYFIRTNGVIIPSSSVVTIPAGSDNVLVQIVANNDTESELTETVTLAIAAGPYVPVAPLGGTIKILDNDATVVDISQVVFNQMFEGDPFDIVRFKLERRGDLNAAAFDVNIHYAGTATAGSDYTPTATGHFEPGDVTATFDVQVLPDTLVEGPETIIASVAAATAGAYAVGTNVLTAGATATIVDDDTAPETPVFADDFNDVADDANWTLRFGSVNVESGDYVARFGVDYNAEFNVPAAPHSTSDTLGLVLSVNKLDGAAEAAGVNLYPNGKTFSGDYALRFDMYIMQNGSAATTEYASFGINHDGTHTNWFRNSGAGVPAGWSFDGIWAYVEADGAALGDYVLNSAPAAGLGGPTALASRSAESLAGVFHQPPWTSGSGPGAPGNSPATATPSWAEVELKQVGNVVTLTINNAQIFTYNNTTAFKSGNIMLGYNDAYDSIGTGGGGLVIYDNVRVVSLGSATPTLSYAVTGNNLVLTWTAGATLQSTPALTGPTTTWTDVGTSGTLTVPLPGPGNALFYRVKQ